MTHKDLSWSIESTITFATISRRNYRQIPWQRDTKRIRLKHFFTGLFLTKGCQCFFPFSFFLSPPNFLSLSSSLVLSCTVDTRLHASFELHRQKRLSNGCYCGALTSIRCDSLFELFRGKKTDRQETAATRAWPHLCLLLKKKERKKKEERKKEEKRKEQKEWEPRVQMCSTMDVKSWTTENSVEYRALRISLISAGDSNGNFTRHDKKKKCDSIPLLS